MKRALSSHGHMMPSAFAGRDMQAIQSWWNPDILLQSRYSRPLSPQRQDLRTIHSSRKLENLYQNRPTQESSSGDARASAILHGPKPTSRPHQQPNHNRPRGLEGAGKSRPTPPKTAQTGRQGVRDSHAQNKVPVRTTKPRGSPPVQQRRKDPVALKDEVYFRKTMHIPTQEDYPNLKASIFQNPLGTIESCLSNGTFAQEVKKSAPGVFQCTFTCNGLDIEPVTGEGFTKSSASRAAFLHFKAKLHELGEFENAFQLYSRIHRDVLNEEKDAKIDIFNYAARFDYIPEFNTIPIYKPGSRTQVGIQVEVKLLQQDINVVAKGKSLEIVETAAALKFKEAAERFQVRQGTEAFVVKDFFTLTTRNAKAFFEFYKTQHRHTRVDVEVKTAKGMESYLAQSPWRAQVLIDLKPVGKPIDARSKKQAEELASLTAAVEVKIREPEIYPKFVKALKAGRGEILKPILPVEMPVGEDSLLSMRQTLLDARRAGLADEAENLSPDEEIVSRKFSKMTILSGEPLKTRHLEVQQACTAYLRDPRLEGLRRKKAELPMNQYRAKVLELISQNACSIIVGATGSGKTTQVPQILFEDAAMNGTGGACNIICTQPRRIAATSVAQRVAQERGENLQDTVGYHVRFDSKLPRIGGSIKYCTTGILLQQLQHYPDEILDSTSHIVVDEVHERDVPIDFLLILLKKALGQRLASGKPMPKIVLMSATMDTDLFASYFSTYIDGEEHLCPSLSVPGRTFPVKERYLDNVLAELRATYNSKELQLLDADPMTKQYLADDQKFARLNPSLASGGQAEVVQPEDFVIDWKKERKVTAEGEVVVSIEDEEKVVPIGLIATTIAHIAKTSTDGAILVFLPGLDEILAVEKSLRLNRPLGVNFEDKSEYEVYKLHSTLPAGQKEVFDDVAQGCRKIILATNIAETSITIPDVQYVVDSGKLREKQYDQQRRITRLQLSWISKSNSKQRAGRAGRVQNGNYYALFSKARCESLRAVGVPEMLRADLQGVCLDIKAQALKFPIREFLAAAIEPPSPKTVDSSVMSLQALDALTDDEMLTPLGRLLASLPIHPSLGKMVVLGIIFRCLDPMLILGAAASERALFINVSESRKEANTKKQLFVDGSSSDHIMVLNAVRQMRTIRTQRSVFAMRDYAYSNFIHVNCFNNIDSTARQIEEVLVEAGLIPYIPPYAQANSEYGDPALNKNSHNKPLIKALLMAGLYPNLAVNVGGRGFRTPGERAVIVHPSSVNASSKATEERPPFGTLYTYTTMSRTTDSSLFMRETSKSTPLIATLFGGKLEREGPVLRMDDWLPFYVKSGQRSAPQVVFEFRKGMDRLFAGVFKDLTAQRTPAPGAQNKFLADDEVREVFARGVVDVLTQDARINRTDPGQPWRKTMSDGRWLEDKEKTAFDTWTPRDGGGKVPGYYSDLMARKFF